MCLSKYNARSCQTNKKRSTCRFMPGYSKIVQPLNKLLEGYCTEKKSRRSRNKAKSPASWELGQVQQSAFDSVKRHLTQPPILGIAFYSSYRRLRFRPGCSFIAGAGRC